MDNNQSHFMKKFYKVDFMFTQYLWLLDASV